MTERRDKEMFKDYQRVWANTPKEVLAEVRAVLARLQITEPQLRMADMLTILLSYGVRHIDEVLEERKAHHARGNAQDTNTAVGK